MGAEVLVESTKRPGPVTKIRYRWVCEIPVDLLRNLGTHSGLTIYRYLEGPMEPHARTFCVLYVAIYICDWYEYSSILE